MATHPPPIRVTIPTETWCPYCFGPVMKFENVHPKVFGLADQVLYSCMHCERMLTEAGHTIKRPVERRPAPQNIFLVLLMAMSVTLCLAVLLVYLHGHR